MARCKQCRRRKRWCSRCRVRHNTYMRNRRRENPSKARKQAREVYRANRAALLKYQREYARLHRERLWLLRVARTIDCTFDELLAAHKRQRGRCAICRQHQRVGTRVRLYADHDHESGRFRAFLCFRCNALLGYSAERIATLESEVRYLKKYHCVRSGNRHA
jgi:hypothetical protein